MHEAEEETFWRTQIDALYEEAEFRRRERIASFRFRLAELSILAATATAALVAIRWRETGSGRFLSGFGAVAFLLACLAEIVLVWCAATGNKKLQAFSLWDTIATLIFVAGLLMAIAGVALLV